MSTFYLKRTFIQRLTLVCCSFPFIGRCRRHKSGIPPEVMSTLCVTSWCSMVCLCLHALVSHLECLRLTLSPWAREPIGYITRTTPCTNGAGKTICSVLFEKPRVTSLYRNVTTYTLYRWENIDCSLFIGVVMAVSQLPLLYVSSWPG